MAGAPGPELPGRVSVSAAAGGSPSTTTTEEEEEEEDDGEDADDEHGGERPALPADAPGSPAPSAAEARGFFRGGGEAPPVSESEEEEAEARVSSPREAVVGSRGGAAGEGRRGPGGSGRGSGWGAEGRGGGGAEEEGEGEKDTLRKSDKGCATGRWPRILQDEVRDTSRTEIESQLG